MPSGAEGRIYSGRPQCMPPDDSHRGRGEGRVRGGGHLSPPAIKKEGPPPTGEGPSERREGWFDGASPLLDLTLPRPFGSPCLNSASSICRGLESQRATLCDRRDSVLEAAARVLGHGRGRAGQGDCDVSRWR